MLRIAFAAMALTLSACDQNAAPPAGAGATPQLDAPAPGSQPARTFAAANDAAQSATGVLTISVAQRLPDSAGAAAQEVLTLRGENGLIVEAEITGAVSPATQVENQTLRALLELPVEEPQVLVYRVESETKPESGQGLCGEVDAAFVVVWEPSGPGEAVLKVMGASGGAPGAAGARACPMLSYQRN